MKTRLTTAAAALTGLLAAGTLAACGADQGEDPFTSGGGEAEAGTIVVGSANFPESELLMEMYAQALEDRGVEVETKPNIGSREVYMKAFEAGDITLLPEYNGALLSYLVAPDAIPEDVNAPEEVYEALQEELPEDAVVLEQSEAEDKDTLTVTSETAEEYDLEAIPDLQGVAGELVIGGPPEFRERYQGLVGLEEVYGLQFKDFRPLDAGGPLTVQALQDGDIDVANVFSTSSAIEVNDWVVLDDPENLFLSQNILPLIKEDAVTPEVEEALNAVSAALTTDNLTEALARVQVDKVDPSVVAEEFLTEQGVI